jgi:DNA-binding transcriptional LysR family regulator
MLKAFDAFGKTGGVRKAAGMLGLNHAAVSRQLAALEAYVGAALIDREGAAIGSRRRGANIISGFPMPFRKSATPRWR